jgi:hypothetical protein
MNWLLGFVIVGLVGVGRWESLPPSQLCHLFAEPADQQ